MSDKILGDTDNPFKPGDIVLEWIVFLVGMGTALLTLGYMREWITVSQMEFNVLFGFMFTVTLVVLSGVMRRLRQGE